jgi:hypothetical protein
MPGDRVWDLSTKGNRSHVLITHSGKKVHLTAKQGLSCRFRFNETTTIEKKCDDRVIRDHTQEVERHLFSSSFLLRRVFFIRHSVFLCLTKLDSWRFAMNSNEKKGRCCEKKMRRQTRRDIYLFSAFESEITCWSLSVRLHLLMTSSSQGIHASRASFPTRETCLPRQLIITLESREKDHPPLILQREVEEIRFLFFSSLSRNSCSDLLHQNIL